MKEEENKLWLTRVEPFAGESISHFLGRFRCARGNRFSAPGGLGEVTGLGSAIARWEKFYFSPFPRQKELEKLAKVVMLDVDRLQEMFPYEGMVTQTKPTMLCALCYQEEPYHRLEWQDKNKRGCPVHSVRLLSQCTNCGTPFPIPSLWIENKCGHEVSQQCCERCHLSFVKMSKKQKFIN